MTEKKVITENYFNELAAVDCSAYVEKKGKFSYLSWSFAVSELLKRHPDATWRVVENAEGWPYWSTPAGTFVKVTVSVGGVERTQIHPVLDSNNKTIPTPNAFQVNTSIQRALVKAIALHGLGLYIYAGEDLPDVVREDREEQQAVEHAANETADDAKAAEWIKAVNAVDLAETLDAMGHEIAKAGLSPGAAAKVRSAFTVRLHVLKEAA